MNDFLSKLLAGLPKKEPQDMFENDSYLNVNQLPSPLMSPIQSTQLESTQSPVEVIQQPVQPNPVVQAAIKKLQNKQIPQPVNNVPEIQEEVRKPIDLQELLTSTDELSKAQDESRDIMSKLLMVKGANQIGAALARQKPDDNYVKDFMDLAKAKPQDILTKNKEARDASRFNIDQKKLLFELGDKERENDPNSDVSKAFREYARSYVEQAGSTIKIDDRLSMADLQKQMGIIGNSISAKMAQDARKEAMAMNTSAKHEATKEKQDIKNLDYLERMNKQMRESDGFKAAKISDGIVTSLEDALKNPSAIKEIAATYESVKSLDPSSAVREAEVGLLQQGLSLREKLEALKSKATSNPRIYGNEFLKKMKEYAEFKRELSKRLYEKEFAASKNLAKKKGLSDQDIEDLDPMTYMKNSQSQATQPESDPRIDAFMKKNNISNREEAIKILKQAGKL